MSAARDFDLERLAAHPWLAGFHYLAETASTNDVALAESAAVDVACPRLILAGHQYGGRGRGANSWWSSDGALTFTLLIDAGGLGLDAEDRPLIALATGLAMTEALGPFAEHQRLRVKWPNDIYLEQRKLGGILVESGRGPLPRVAIGIGINVNNSLREAPEDVRQRATALIDDIGACDRTEVLWACLTALEQYLRALAADVGIVYERWAPVCLLSGTRVEVVRGAQRIRGICRGINPRGALLVESPQGVESCYAGTVYWEAADDYPPVARRRPPQE